MGATGETPTPSQLGKQPLSAEQYQSLRWEREIEERNRMLSDEELDAMLPPEGYKVTCLQPSFVGKPRACIVRHFGPYLPSIID